MKFTNHQKGLAAGLFCFLFWGFAPLYFKLIQNVPFTLGHQVTFTGIWLALFIVSWSPFKRLIKVKA